MGANQDNITMNPILYSNVVDVPKTYRLQNSNGCDESACDILVQVNAQQQGAIPLQVIESHDYCELDSSHFI